MKGSKTRGILFLFWLIMATLSILWILFCILANFNLIFSDIIYQFTLIFSCLIFFGSILSLYTIMSKLKKEIIVEKEKQKNIRDFYLYTQLLDPPTTNN